MVKIVINIPDWLAAPFVALTLLYRRIWYGYPFRRIPLTQGQYAIVDPEDYERINKHKWHVIRGANTYYACRFSRIGKKRVSIKMHRQIINLPDHLLVDYISRNGLDNRKANLRPANNEIYLPQSSAKRIPGRFHPPASLDFRHWL